VLIADQPTLLVARKDLPVGNMGELIGYATANKGHHANSAAGAARTGHVECALINDTDGGQHRASAHIVVAVPRCRT